MVKRWQVAVGLQVVLGLGILIGALGMYTVVRSGAVAQERATVAFSPQERATLASLESALVRVIETVRPTVVHIRVPSTTVRSDESGSREIIIPDGRLRIIIPRPDGSEEPYDLDSWVRIIPRFSRQGSGVIIRSDGYIVTNDHVVGSAKEVEVIFHDGSKAKGKVIRAPGVDIALVKVDRTNLPTAALGDSSTVKPGQLVFAVGSPFGLTNSVTMGIVSATGRFEAVSDGGRTRVYTDLIQTDAAINSGNSGGPLINTRGEVIGINTAIVGNVWTGGNVGIGFAIPINRVKNVVKRLIETGSYQRGFLGVAPSDIPAEMRETLGTSQGVLIRSVEEGTPAARAGIEPGDVIVEVDGVPVRDANHFRELIADKGPNAKVRLKVLRDSKTLTLEATLTTHPEDEGDESAVRAERPAEKKVLERLGIEVDDEIPAELERLLGDRRGVYVRNVRSGSPAAGELRAGDIILAVNQTPVGSVAELERALSAVPSGQRVRLQVLRREGERAMRMLAILEMP
ncbi:MAG: PDZ domain-containing protein [Fimbriimonadales bacterium]|nr:PDZ domain-containing protein [Fimbriimonadales bacterium]MDW8052118.1 PDZ domain-containing protein [Armatimonadota bacterium]